MDEQELKQMLENHIRDQTKISRELLERITRVETKQDSLLQTCPACQLDIKEQGKAIVKVTESAKAAHHRIDGVYKAAGLISAGVGLLISLLSFLFNNVPKGGGH
ncbi:hypothetical protein [Sporomusa sphaeroides]|uniref:hypothetical protein n=1 Tax=Sporomusa sphaeroides TaxID=47679 RepID=UPI00202E7725|nr:hypothetical protein [Sporomusa sphaeroides]MCM0759929.1 hypothetical protein [Sporomusa sphaeroides DSM 2875]HML33871.1 hypothetical protein [Sporomusa sphaeroides]